MNRRERGNTPTQSSNTANGPYGRIHLSSAPRSPIKSSHYGKAVQELGLSLKRVIGTTCQDVTSFDCLPVSCSFAYTAGAAAVVAAIDAQGAISQRFYRANPVQPSSASRGIFANGMGRDSPDARYKSPLQNRDFPSSHSPRNATSDWNDSPSGKQGNVKERVRAATAVSFSPNGKYLAVGETGYRPRVLIFSLDEKAPQDVPVAAIHEHSFGVHALAFSPDSKHLASMGTANDGFLYIWDIDDRTGAVSLVASNKCTTIVKQMAWMGQQLITVGVRFAKIWRPNDVAPSCDTPERKFGKATKPLVGRNALLGDLIEATFTCVVPILDGQAVICTDGGDVCILDDSERHQRLIRLANVPFSITAACLDSSSRLLVTGSNGSTEIFHTADLQTSCTTPTSPSSVPSAGKSSPTRTVYYTAIGSVGEFVVTVDNNHGIQIRYASSADAEDKFNEEIIHDVPAHSDAVLGVRALPTPNDMNASFLTWSAGGTVIFWSSDCEMRATVQVPMTQSVDVYNIVNELKSVTSSLSAPHTISGDRYGMIRVSDTSSGEVKFSVRAHAGEITDLAIHEDTKQTLVASSSRDRTIQLFDLSSGELTLLQTLDEHAGSVTCVQFAKQGSQLLSCSADRTVVVREAVSKSDGNGSLFVIARTITLKNSPTSMRLSLYEDAILLAATDRCCQLVNVQTGRIMSSFKASDSEGGDAVIMSSLAHLPSSTGSPIIAGVSSSDKSVRLYSEDGYLLARDWGHTEGVTDIAVIQPSGSSDGSDSAKIVTVAADGTIFIWDTVSGRPASSGSDQGLQVPAVLGLGPASVEPPLRKVISHSELSRFKRSKSIDLSENEPLSQSASTSGHKTPLSLRHKNSRLNVKSTPRLDPSTLANYRIKMSGNVKQDAKSNRRSPSPPSPMPSSPLRQKHSMNVRPSTSGSTSASNGNKGHDGDASKVESSGFGSLSASTEQLCRTLKAYRHRLEKASAGVAQERLTELDRELELTMNLMQRTLLKKGIEIDRSSDKMSIATQSSWTEAEAMGRRKVQEDDVEEEEVTPRRRRVNTDPSHRTQRCESPPERSFVTAHSQQGSGISDEGSERSASGGAQNTV